MGDGSRGCIQVGRWGQISVRNFTQIVVGVVKQLFFLTILEWWVGNEVIVKLLVSLPVFFFVVNLKVFLES